MNSNPNPKHSNQTKPQVWNETDTWIQPQTPKLKYKTYPLNPTEQWALYPDTNPISWSRLREMDPCVAWWILEVLKVCQVFTDLERVWQSYAQMWPRPWCSTSDMMQLLRALQCVHTMGNTSVWSMCMRNSAVLDPWHHMWLWWLIAWNRDGLVSSAGSPVRARGLGLSSGCRPWWDQGSLPCQL